MEDEECHNLIAWLNFSLPSHPLCVIVWLRLVIMALHGLLLSELMRLWHFSFSVNPFFKCACAAIQWGLNVWFLVGPFVYFHSSCVRTAKALMRLHGCAGSPEPSLVAYVISTIISWAGTFSVCRIQYIAAKAPMTKVAPIFKINVKSALSDGGSFNTLTYTCNDRCHAGIMFISSLICYLVTKWW